MKALKVTMFLLVLLAVCLLMVASVDAQGPVRGQRLTSAQRVALRTVRYGQWAWDCMYYDATTIYGGVRYGYRVGVGAASTFLTPRYAR